MPVRQLKLRVDEPGAQDLVRRLVDEWKNPNSTAAQPIILEEFEGKKRTSVYVIWDDWGNLSDIERSELIVEAFEQRYGLDETLNLRSAMGLTAIEAKRLGIE